MPSLISQPQHCWHFKLSCLLCQSCLRHAGFYQQKSLLSMYQLPIATPYNDNYQIVRVTLVVQELLGFSMQHLASVTSIQYCLHSKTLQFRSQVCSFPKSVTQKSVWINIQSPFPLTHHQKPRIVLVGYPGISRQPGCGIQSQKTKLHSAVI